MSAALTRAKRLYSKGRMQDALVAANEALTRNSKSPDAMLLMAKICEALGDRNHAGIF